MGWGMRPTRSSDREGCLDLTIGVQKRAPLLEAKVVDDLTPFGVTRLFQTGLSLAANQVSAE